jgi:hypothetical protein
LETAITEKKRQVERLVSEMKEANLQSLAVAPPEEIRQLLEGRISSIFILLIVFLLFSYF